MRKSLFEKVWDAHAVRTLANGQTQLLVGTHLIHEVTSPQAFGMLRDLGLKVAMPHRTFATVDHIVPTDQFAEPYRDPLAQAMMEELRKNCASTGITFFDRASGKQGIVHIVGPEQGITQPGTTIACGDSHTSTHGAFGAIAFGIGTTQIRDVLATQTMALGKLKVRRIEVSGKLLPGVYAKDAILHIIRTLGVNGGTGFAYEYAGEVFDRFTMEERMTVCNMSIEGGARAGLIAPDEKTFEYVKGRPHAPKGAAWEAAMAYWQTLFTDEGAHFDKVITIKGEDIAPVVTWGTSPEDVLPITATVPAPESFKGGKVEAAQRSLDYMGLTAGQKLTDIEIDTVFIGSCTNGRIEDLRAAAEILKGKKIKVKRAMVVPGSGLVRAQAEEEGLADIFKEAGFEWRLAGCSMCLAMNPDQLSEGERCASTSNRNFEGRQGYKGRTHLVSPAMAAAAAITGHLTDVREMM